MGKSKLSLKELKEGFMGVVNHGHKLTKTFLMGLAEGVYLISNVCERSGMPSFGEKLKPVDQRQDQWLRIKKAGVDNQLCRVFDTKADCEEWKKDVIPAKAKPESR